jgi:hypothetical protein
MRSILTLLAAAVLLAAGCGGPRDDVRAYATLTDYDRAMQVSEAVVEGEVEATTFRDRVPVGDAFGLAGSNMDCVRPTRVTMRVRDVLKGSVPGDEPVAFWFLSPCYALDPDVLLGQSLPAVMSGERLRVYLARRQGEWWLQAHQRWYPPAPEQTTAEWSPLLAPGQTRYYEIPADGAVIVPGADGAVAPPPPTPPSEAPVTTRYGATTVTEPPVRSGDIVTPAPGGGLAPRPPRRERFPRRETDRWWPPPQP